MTAPSQAAAEILAETRALYDAALPGKHSWTRGDDVLTQMSTTVAVKSAGVTVGVRFRNLAFTRSGSPLPLDPSIAFVNVGGYVVDVEPTYDPETGEELTPAVVRWAPMEAVMECLWRYVDTAHPVE